MKQKVDTVLSHQSSWQAWTLQLNHGWLMFPASVSLHIQCRSWLRLSESSSRVGRTLLCLITTSVAPAALGDSIEGSNASEDRCKSPTSGRPPGSLPASYNKTRVLFWNCHAAICHVGSTSPCNSDDERKQKFIEKGTVWLRAARLSTFEHLNMAAGVWFVFVNLISSEVQKQTLFQDGCQWLW